MTKRRKRVQLSWEDARRREDNSASSSGSSSANSTSDSSPSATNPVSSATTLQTIPSPPSLSDEGVGVEKEDYLRLMTIPVSAALNSPRLLRPILSVPVTTANTVWKRSRLWVSTFTSFCLLSFINKGFLLGLERNLRSIVSLQMQDLRTCSFIGQCPGGWA